ncbi:hypothetical protein [Anaerostipes sp. MSJ-23]|uniref:hypothetical protein n=1 Tax=unclassified Anaerostipes TaxID=2635253 RepID=UPI001C0FC924|nr:hypothetical protein [Anaerostipes sp. MSJ-23]MBU5458942.1 hypothetical protein [Anaerostipes sp. MSJ-23]
MIVMICLDDKGGMRFHDRRQSQDRILRQRMKEIVKDAKVFMNETSEKLYQEFQNRVVCKDFLEKAGENDYCLVEDQSLLPLEKEIKKIIIFWWNKIYPADMFFDLSLDQWQLVETKEFEGSSHQITEEIYIKGERE